jgi:hypothetical protein
VYYVFWLFYVQNTKNFTVRTNYLNIFMQKSSNIHTHTHTHTQMLLNIHTITALQRYNAAVVTQWVDPSGKYKILRQDMTHLIFVSHFDFNATCLIVSVFKSYITDVPHYLHHCKNIISYSHYTILYSLLLNWYQGSFPVDKQLGHEVYHSPPPHAAIKKMCSYTSMPPISPHNVDR